MKRLLIVDDKEHLLLLYKIEFEAEGYHVDTARNEQEALGMFEKNHYNLVIIEIYLPGEDGIELPGKLQARDNKLPVIINSASARANGLFVSWAADSFVLKNSDLTELKQKVKESLDERMYVL